MLPWMTTSITFYTAERLRVSKEKVKITEIIYYEEKGKITGNTMKEKLVKYLTEGMYSVIGTGKFICKL